MLMLVMLAICHLSCASVRRIAFDVATFMKVVLACHRGLGAAEGPVSAAAAGAAARRVYEGRGQDAAVPGHGALGRGHVGSQHGTRRAEG